MLVVLGLVANLSLASGAVAPSPAPDGVHSLLPEIASEPLLRLADERPSKRIWRLKLLKKIEEEKEKKEEEEEQRRLREKKGLSSANPGSGAGNGGGDHGGSDDHGSGGDHGDGGNDD